VPLRFLVDENLPADVAGLLERTGYEALHIATSPLRGATDEALWRLAALEERVVVTRDLDFPLPASNVMPAGVVLIRARSDARLQEIVTLFEQFAGKVDWTTVEGNVTIVEPGRIRQRHLGALPSRK
jgi:predicted nuclease of predicted toxin-antitoxin system